MERDRLMRSVPELRANMLDELARTATGLAAIVAERSVRSLRDDEVLAVSRAVIGTTISVWLSSAGEWVETLVPHLDHALAFLESEFRVQARTIEEGLGPNAA